MTETTAVVALRRPQFRVCIDTRKVDEKGLRIWREIGVGFENRGDSLTCMGQTIYGEFRFTLLPIKYERGRPHGGPSHEVFTVRPRGEGKKDKWTSQGIAIPNTHGGFDVTCDTPAGAVEFFIFEVREMKPLEEGDPRLQPPVEEPFFG